MRFERGGSPSQNRRRILCLAVVLGAFFHGAGSVSALVTINTDTLQIFVDGTDVGTSLSGTTFSATHRPGDGAAQFTFQGDLDLAGQNVTFVGSRAASLVANNNADLVGARFYLSGNGRTGGGAGGGAGGGRGLGGEKGQPGSGGTGGGGGLHGRGAGSEGYVGEHGEAGNMGTAGSTGGFGHSGTAGGDGSSGTAGFANAGGAGTGGSGGDGGHGTQGATDTGRGAGGGRGGMFPFRDGQVGTAGGHGGDAHSPFTGPGRHADSGQAGTNTASGFDVLTGGAGGGGAGGGGGGGGGGAGAGGGGAVEIVAHGTIDATGAQLQSTGSTARSGATGGAATAGLNGTPGLPGNAPDDGGGWGGRGGDGGAGQSGSHGGQGGNGGGGAGGTIKLAGSVVITDSGTSTNVRGGTGTGSSAGGDGRLVFGTNTSTGYTGALTGRQETYQGLAQTGLGDLNPHIKPGSAGGVETPYVPDLQGGAAVTGLLAGIDAQATEFQSIMDAAAPESMAALYRLDTGPTGYDHDFVGFDMLLLLNLQGEALLDPVLGYDPLDPDSLFASGLISDGLLLSSLDAYGIYATLIPEGATLFNLGATGSPFASSLSLTNDEFLFLGSPTTPQDPPNPSDPPAVPVPGSVLLTGLGLSLLGWACRRRQNKKA